MQRDPDAVRVLFLHSNPIDIRISDWIELQLKVGQSLTQAELKQLETCASIVEAERVTKRYLTGRVRTCQQVRIYLTRREIEESIAEAVIQRLKRAGILDDNQYSEWFVEQQATRMGPRKMEAKLHARGVERQTAQDAVNRVVTDRVENDAVLLAARKFIRQKGFPETRSERIKFMNHLLRKGFSPGKVRSIVFDVLSDIEDVRFE